MPPQATGFRYTPASYLHNIGGSDDGGRQMEKDELLTERELEALAALEEEHLYRPTVGRKLSPAPPTAPRSINKNFQSRIQKRKDLYRGILKGDRPIEDHSWSSARDWQEDSSSDLERYDTHQHDLDPIEHSMTVWKVENSILRNDRRQAHGTTSDDPSTSSAPPGRPSNTTSSSASSTISRHSDTDALHLRAQRLRTAKKVSADEQDFSETLRQRRLAEVERQRIDRLRHQEQLRIQKQQQQQQLNQRQRKHKADPDLDYPMDESILLQTTKRRANNSMHRRRAQPPPKNASAHSSAKRAASPAPTVDDSTINEFTLMEEVQFMLRESGLLKHCVVSCFGVDDEDLREDAKKMDSNHSSSHNRPRSHNSTHGSRTSSPYADMDISDDSDVEETY